MKTNQTQKLQNYLIGLGGVSLLATTSNAAVVTMNITPIDGPNAGFPVGTPGPPNYIPPSVLLSTMDAGLTGEFKFWNDPVHDLYGIQGDIEGKGDKTYMAYEKSPNRPRQYAPGQTIDATATFTGSYETVFNAAASAWGAGSYMGFKSANNHYGWLEVTWSPTIKTFEVLAGAYESVADVGITTPVPEPSSLALLVAGAGAVAALRRRKTAARA